MSRAIKTKRNYAHILATQQSGYCLWKEKRGERATGNSKFWNRVRCKADGLCKVCNQVCMVHIHMIAIYLLQDHTEEKSDLITRNFKGKTPLNRVCCIHLMIRQFSERDEPSFPATDMTSQGMPDNFTVCQ